MGCVHIYCGDGKGKTTAAVGLAVRMAGSGGRVLIARFLKSEASGEVDVLRKIDGISVLPCEKSFGFTWQMTKAQKEEAAEYYTELFEKACSQALRWDEDLLCTGKVLLMLDEICAAVNSGFIEEQRVTGFLDSRPDHMEVVMTGREPSKALLERADYVSEIKKVKHPFDHGQEARKGVEY